MHALQRPASRIKSISAARARSVARPLALAITAFALTATAQAATVVTELLVNRDFTAGLAGWTQAVSTTGSVEGTCSYNAVTAPGTETLTNTPGFTAIGGATTAALGSVSVTAPRQRSCVLYQDIAIPVGATTLTFSLDAGIKLLGGLNAGDTSVFVGLYLLAGGVPNFQTSVAIGGNSKRLGVPGISAGTSLVAQTGTTLDVAALAGTTVRFAINNFIQSPNGNGIPVTGAATVVGLGRVSARVTVVTPDPPPAATSQTLTFGPAPGLIPGGTGPASATSTSGLDVSIGSLTPAVCSVAFSQPSVVVTALTLGTCTLAANQSGNASYLAAAQVLTSFAIGSRTADVRTYVPLSDAGSGYVSAIRVVNPSSMATTVAVGVIDDATGAVSALRNLPVIVPPGGAVTFDSVQIEAALALTAALPASKRPRLRVAATEAVPIEVQSYLRNPSGVFNEVSGAQTGAAGVAINVRTFVPSSSPAYVSTLRFINTGAVATPVSVARMDPVTGAASAPATLIASLPAGAAVSLGAGQIEAALGRALAPADRPRLQVVAASSALEVQTYLSQPAGGFAEVSAAQTGTSVMVRSFYPSNTPNRTSFVRIINAGVAGTTPIFATLIDNATGQTLANGVLASSLLAGAVVTYTSSQIEAALNYIVAAGVSTRLRIASSGAPLEVQSYLAQPNGWFTNVSNAQVGNSPVVKLHVPQIDSPTGYASSLRITNTGAQAAEVRASLIDDVIGTAGKSQVLIASLAAGATQTLTAAQVEAVFGIGLGNASLTRINPGARPRLGLSSTQVLEVQSLLSNPAGVMTDISTGQ